MGLEAMAMIFNGNQRLVTIMAARRSLLPFARSSEDTMIYEGGVKKIPQINCYPAARPNPPHLSIVEVFFII